MGGNYALSHIYMTSSYQDDVIQIGEAIRNGLEHIPADWIMDVNLCMDMISNLVKLYYHNLVFQPYLR